MLKLDLTKQNFENWWDIKYAKSKFPGGELHLRLEKGNCANSTPDYFNSEVEIISRLNSSDDIIELMLAVDALRRFGVKEINAFIPYIPYGRQDRKCNIGEAFSLKVFANLINPLKFRKIKTVDPHSDVTSALIDNLEVVENRLLRKYPVENGHTEFNLLIPDAGAIKRTYGLLERYFEFWSFHKINIVECSKVRDLKTTKILEGKVPKIENDLPCYIVDDICDGGRTFIEMAKKIRENGNLNELYLIVSHGIFSAGEDELGKYFKQIYTTNSIRDEDIVITSGIRPVPSKLIKRFKLW